ncbi:MAG: tRNA dihydrouridine synthase [Pirellulaceae bacterium]
MTAAVKSLRIGEVDIGLPVVQAALSGYSDWPMRVIARRHGASYTLCEVMLDQFLLEIKQRAKTQRFLHISDDERPVGGQLMGAEPEQFSAGALKLVEAGFDVIDINFGCPVKKVLGRCRGGFHLGQPEVARDIVRRTRSVVPPHIPVTLKMRRGIDDTTQSRDWFFEILESALAEGVAAVTVHGRTVEQRYNGPSDWGFLAEAKRTARDTVLLGSGDLFSARDCLNMLDRTGVDGVSVARGAIGNPWIFSQTKALLAGLPLPKPPTLHEQREVIREHYALAEQLYDSKRCGQIMRKFGIKYSALHPQPIHVRQSFTQVQNQQDWDDVLERWYAQDLPGQYGMKDEG